MRTLSRSAAFPLAAVTAVLAVLLAGVPAVSGKPRPKPAPEATQEAPSQLPFFVQGVDLTIPAQDAFRSWPPKELKERPYWLPWSFISFERAHLFSRPVLFLLTVEWSRSAERLEHETLSDPEVLRAVNDDYVSVRVDADRRPDIRERYRSGSWPVVALLLADGMPVLSQANPTGKALPIAAGYLDKNAMLFLLREGKTYYERNLATLLKEGKRWAEIGEEKPVAGAPTASASDQMARWLLGNADQGNGGFGVAPKLVIPGLVEYARIREATDPALAEHARNTLLKLVASPLHDRRDGGFHRIALSPGWEGIQYEKMLDTNAAFIRDAVFALRGADSAELREALRSTCRFLTETLSRPGGGFYLAQDADLSSPDGGGFWTEAEPGRDPSKRPPVDHLVLTGDNAAAGAALLRAAVLLEDPALESAGRTAVDLVLERTSGPGRGVDHVLEPSPEPLRFLATQADTSFAMLDAYESTGDARYLRAGRDIADFALNNLLAEGEKALRDRIPEIMTIGVLSSPRHPVEENARMARALLRLSAQGLGESYRAKAASILGEFAGDFAVNGVFGIESALAVEELASPPLVVRIEGAGEEAKELRRAALGLSRSWVVIATALGESGRVPGAVVTWRGKSSPRVERAGSLASEAERLLAAGAGEAR